MSILKTIAFAAGFSLLGIACVAEEDPGDELNDFRMAGDFCGGIAGIQCPGTFVCVDDPSDTCDPKTGGADCGGICLPGGGQGGGGGPPACDLKPEACAVDCVLDQACPQQCHCPGGGDPCGDDICTPHQTCCSGIPFPEPTCINGDICPISERKHKDDIHYLGDTELQTLHGDLMDHKVATYRYKKDGEQGPSHLGFIIDDVAPSPSVMPSGERVSMYGYTTMAVAALQVQAQRIEQLERQLAELEARLDAKPRK